MPLSTALQAGSPAPDLVPDPATAAPMDAARRFAQALQRGGLLQRTWRLKCELHGPAATAMDHAVMLGLEGFDMDRLDAGSTSRLLRRIQDKREIRLLGQRRIAFEARRHMTHASAAAGCALRLSAFDPAGQLLLDERFEVPPARLAPMSETA
ncbi:serine dehydratase beta chain [Azohydromonas lata]|uniref:serine dehydratase beta chain n=1 Tax=Azohydromonas lata TaxID=45677 RepID=UPI00083156C4|nr:serine dehydratase beta chain [Azohydromonas lata]